MGNVGMGSNLDKLVNIEKAKRTMLTGKSITMIEVMTDIANFCGVGFETIKSYKDGKSIPSLPIALKLSEYFRVSVNEVFIIEDYSTAIQNIGNKGRKPNPQNKQCKYGECTSKAIAKGLCQKHYQQQRSGKIEVS